MFKQGPDFHFKWLFTISEVEITRIAMVYEKNIVCIFTHVFVAKYKKKWCIILTTYVCLFFFGFFFSFFFFFFFFFFLSFFFFFFVVFRDTLAFFSIVSVSFLSHMYRRKIIFLRSLDLPMTTFSMGSREKV